MEMKPVKIRPSFHHVCMATDKEMFWNYFDGMIDGMPFFDQFDGIWDHNAMPPGFLQDGQDPK